MQEIVSAVVADVPKNTAAKDRRSYIPIPIKYSMGELVEWSCKHHKEGRWHYQPVSVHREVVVDAM